MRIAAIVAIAAGCSFSGPSGGPGDGDGDQDAGVDAPPPIPEVRFTSITSGVTELRPGLYGFEITAVLENGLDTGITAVGVSLSFADGSKDRSADFSWREPDAREGAAAPQPDTIAAGDSQSYTFVVDALAAAAPPGPIRVNGTATFSAGSDPGSATPAESPLELPFVGLPAPIVVDEINDEQNDNNDISLREAIALANANPGLDRIVFDAAAIGTGATLLLDENRGELTIDGDLVIDGGAADPVLAFDAGWNDTNQYGIRVTSGRVVISGLTLRNMGFGYTDEDIAGTGNCGPSSTQFEGGAIRVDDGTLILDGNTIEDPDVPERNCFAASVRIEGGSGHRILRNRWTAVSMDALFVDAATVEIADNLIDSTPNSDKSDECIYIESQGGQDLWVIGNLCVDQEFSAVIPRGTDDGTLHVVHNTFVRTGLSGLAAVRREEGSRTVRLRNNVYADNNASVGPDNDGDRFDIAFEASTNDPLCESCDMATVDDASIITGGDLALVDASGTTRADLTPAAGSPLLDSATPLVDRNGTDPGWFGGDGADRGAVER